MSTAVIVTGIGASGTSMIAGCLHKMGCPMGKHLAQHPAGFELYEDSCLYGVFRLPEKRMRTALTSYAVTHAAGQELWGLKHTLAWKAFSFLPELYRGLGDEVRVVVSWRTLGASIRARMEGRCPPGQTYSLQEATDWAMRASHGLLASLMELTDTPVLHLSYEHVLDDPAGELLRLGQFVGTKVTLEALEHIARD